MLQVAKVVFKVCFQRAEQYRFVEMDKTYLHLSSLATNKEKILREITVHGFLRGMSATSFAVIGVIGSFESETANAKVATDFILKVNQKLPLIVQRFFC